MKSMRKGFTLIELMIVIAIIAIIAAIAIPNLMQSRIRANEAAAISTIKEYATAQVTFQVGKQGRNPANTGTTEVGYADNFENLYYGVVAGQEDAARPMALINKAMADARGADTGATDTNEDTLSDTRTIQAYQGYFLNEPTDQDDYIYDFAILATPAHSTNTGTNAYWVNQEGTVYMMGLAANLSQKGGEDVTSLGAMATTPSTAAERDKWSVN